MFETFRFAVQVVVWKHPWRENLLKKLKQEEQRIFEQDFSTTQKNKVGILKNSAACLLPLT